jgi:ATP-dependent Clp protease ATP-binding subunit ClpA
MHRIVDQLLAKTNQKLAKRRIVVELSPPARARIAEEGRDPVSNARPLRRYFEKQVELPLGDAILEGNVGKGTRVLIDVHPNRGYVVRTSPLQASVHTRSPAGRSRSPAAR